MYPDYQQFNPGSVRFTIGKLKACGVTQETIAKRIGKSSRALRNYIANDARCDYPLQYTLEAMLKHEKEKQSIRRNRRKQWLRMARARA